MDLFIFSFTDVYIPTVAAAELKSADVANVGSFNSVNTLFTSVRNVAMFCLCC